MSSQKDLVVVTGGAGYVGSVLVPQLINEGFMVRVLDFLMFGGEGLLGVWGDKNFELRVGDLRDKDFVDRGLEGAIAVIHLAALVGGEACDFNRRATRQINFEATKNLVDTCEAKGIERFIFASTCSNYGMVKGDKIVDESSPLDSTTSYTETKIAAEEYLLSKKGDRFCPCVLRLAMKFGLSPKMRFNLIVNEFARDAAVKKKVRVYSPQAWRAFTHVRDAAQAYILCLKAPRDKIFGEIFNVSTQNFQKAQLVELLKKHLPQTQMEIIEGKTDPRSYRISTERIRKVLGFKPEKTVEQGFLEVTEALRKGVFVDPYDPKYEIWYDESKL